MEEEIQNDGNIEGVCIGCGKEKIIDPDTKLCDECAYESDADDDLSD